MCPKPGAKKKKKNAENDLCFSPDQKSWTLLQYSTVCHKSDQVAPFKAEWSGGAAGSLLLLLLKH